MLQVSAETRAAIIARPEAFLAAYNAVGGGSPTATVVRSQLGAPFASLTDAGCMATFASLVAFGIAPMGTNANAPMSVTLGELLNSQALTYLDFCKLSALLSLIGSPGLVPADVAGGAPAEASTHFLLWLADVPLGTGVHAQLVVANVLDKAYLLLDPTYAFALRIPFSSAGPDPGLTVVENAATMMQTPIAAQNLAVLDPAGTAAMPQLLTAATNGALGPQYIDHDVSSGSEGWDNHFARSWANMG